MFTHIAKRMMARRRSSALRRWWRRLTMLDLLDVSRFHSRNLDALLAMPPSDAEPDSFTCPRCRRTSYHPTDVAEGYCGACHDWTRAR